MQRTSDSWRNPMASSTQTSLTAFFESNEEFNTDESRQAFATDYLKDMKFLYSNTQSAVSFL